ERRARGDRRRPRLPEPARVAAADLRARAAPPGRVPRLGPLELLGGELPPPLPADLRPRGGHARPGDPARAGGRRLRRPRRGLRPVRPRGRPLPGPRQPPPPQGPRPRREPPRRGIHRRPPLPDLLRPAAAPAEGPGGVGPPSRGEDAPRAGTWMDDWD